jgi:hypothetical protein
MADKPKLEIMVPPPETVVQLHSMGTRPPPPPPKPATNEVPAAPAKDKGS